MRPGPAALLPLALLLSAGMASARPAGGGVLGAFLEAYRNGDCASLRAFVDERYHPRVLERPGLAAQFAASFAQLRNEFGPLEPLAESYDSTYRAVRHHLYAPAVKEWVTILFVPDSATGKTRGHGLWKLEPPPGWTRPADARPVDARLRAQLRDLGAAGLFSGSVMLAGERGIRVDTALGTADGHRALGPRDRFPIASITKMFTAAAVLLLESDGKLALDDPVSKHVPEYPRDVADQVTIRHLLLHTSGIEIDDCATFMAARDSARTVAELVATQIAFLDSLNEGRRKDFRPPGTFDYSNENYDLLGGIVERVSGSGFDRFLDRRILRPAGMRATSFEGAAGLKGLSHRHGGVPDPCARTSVDLASAGRAPSPSGGLSSTTEDLRRFLAWLRAPRGASGSLFDRMCRDTVAAGEARAYGLGVELLGGPAGAIGHNGGIAGASGELRYFPGQRLVLVALCNRERSAPDLLQFLLRTGPR